MRLKPQYLLIPPIVAVLLPVQLSSASPDTLVQPAPSQEEASSPLNSHPGMWKHVWEADPMPVYSGKPGVEYHLNIQLPDTALTLSEMPIAGPK